MKKYLLISGYVPKGDGDRLFISNHNLMQLYGVKPHECEIYTGEFTKSEMADLIALEPDPTGAYALPTNKIGN